MNPTTSVNEHLRRYLQAYGTPLFEYEGQGTVRRKDGTSRNLAFEAGQFSDGKIIVVGKYDDFDPSFLFGGGAPELEVQEFSGVTSEGWTLRSVGLVSWTNYLPKTQGEGAYDAFRLHQLDSDRVADPSVIQKAER